MMTSDIITYWLNNYYFKGVNRVLTLKYSACKVIEVIASWASACTCSNRRL